MRKSTVNIRSEGPLAPLLAALFTYSTLGSGRCVRCRVRGRNKQKCQKLLPPGAESRGEDRCQAKEHMILMCVRFTGPWCVHLCVCARVCAHV